MSKRLLGWGVALLLALVSLSAFAQQNTATTPAPVLEITGINPTDLPSVIVSANVTDSFGQPVRELAAEQVRITGELADIAQVVRVENITDDNLPIAVVLTLDTSSSMAGLPLERAKQAARLFIEQLADDDLVSIVTFDNRAQVVLDYTTDKQAVLNTIDALPLGGRTALYDAGVLSVQQADAAPINRRVVVLLSDGAEFEEGRSDNPRDAALLLSTQRGVPVYTVGLGFGTDRTYLRALADGTNARFYESPNADELDAIYDEIAALLRTQYIITLDVPVPADGETYELGLAVDLPAGTAEDSVTLFTPVPVPVVNLVGAPEGDINEIVSVAAEVRADDPLERLVAQFDDGEPLTLDPANKLANITIDPVQFAPGAHTLTVTATDTDGESGTATLAFNVAALPPALSLAVEIVGDEANFSETAQVQVQLDATQSQSPVAAAALRIDDGEPLVLAPNPDGTFGGGVRLISLAPGAHTLTVEALSENGQSASISEVIEAPALAPVLRIGLAEDAVISEDSTITYETESQTGEVSVIYSIDGGEAQTADGEIPLNVVAIGAGEHTLTVNAADSNGESVSRSVRFSIPQGALPTATPTLTPTFTPTLTATATETLVPTATATPTETPTEVPTETPTLPPTETPTPAPTNTPNQTETAAAFLAQTEAAVGTATAGALATSEALATADAQGTANALAASERSTATAQAIENARQALAQENVRGTQNALATLTAIAESTALSQQQTLEAGGTAQAESTASALLTQEAFATLNALATANRRATLDVLSTATADVRSTIQAEAGSAQSTLEAESTLQANATATGGPRDVPSATPVGTPVVVDPPAGALPTVMGLPPLVLALVCGGLALVAIIIGLLSVARRRRK